MSTRTLAVVFCAFTLVSACGGDEDSGPECMGAQMSVPGSPNDPCEQNHPNCPAPGMAYATCENEQWSQSCQCVLPTTNTPPTGQQTSPMTQAPVCGDGMITGAETCDGTNLNNETCQSLGYNGGGTLLCNPSRCVYDVLMCRMTTGGGMAGTSGGAGMGGGGNGG